MGQSGISMLNKVGYSMFWNSMWDSKILYSRSLKEDFFLNKFFDLIFNDNVSFNILKKKKINYFLLKKYKIEIENNNKTLYKYLVNTHKLKITPSKVWILKFQKWIIIYKFIYIHNFKNLKSINKGLYYGNNFFYTYKFYKKASILSNYKYNLFKKTIKSFNF